MKMSSFDTFIELVEAKECAPAGKYTGFLIPKIYKRNALVEWLCKCAHKAKYDMRRIDENPKKKKDLILAIGVSINVMSGGAILTDVEGYVVDQLVKDSANKYMQTHPDLLEAIVHWFVKSSS
jgi:hypothetical protein